jgi:hypothetical protein
MAVPSAPVNFNVQTANAEVLLSWDISAGATSYDIQRSTDNVTFASIGTTSSATYLDDTVALGTQYWYKIAAVGTGGTSIYTSSQDAIPTPIGEYALGQIRLMAQETADMVNSQFVTMPEWNKFINLAMFELYDILIEQDPDLFAAPAASFSTDGSTFLYPLPNGVLTFTMPDGSTAVASPFYKLLGVDLATNTAQNGYVTINKFNFISRNRFLYPNTASTIYGVFNLRYRMLGNNIEFIPTPSSGQTIRLWYAPRLQMLLRDTDTTTISISGWIRYVVARAAKYALDKQEQDTSKLDAEILYLKERIENTSNDRDVGQPDTISDVRSNDPMNGNWWGGNNGSSGGW